MKKEEIPQDKSALENYTRELYYVKNREGKYVTGLSVGWDIKKFALDYAWDEIKRRKEEAIDLVKNGKKSPIFYFMESKLMDLKLLSKYTGFSRFTIRRHMKPNIFNRLGYKKLTVYARIFDIDVEELKKFDGA